jgi:hypothetical protein
MHDEAWLATNEHYGIGRHVLGAEDGVAHPGSTRPEAPRCAPPVRSGRHEAAPSQPPMLPSPALQPASGLAAWLCAWIQLSKVQAEQTHPKSTSSAHSHPSLSVVSLLALPFSSSYRSEKRRQQGKQLAVATL